MEEDRVHSPAETAEAKVDRRALIGGSAKLAVAAAAAPLLSPPALAAETEAAPAAAMDGALHVPARIIPVPKSVSPEAQKFLAAGGQFIQVGAGSPPASDKEGWRKRIAEINKAFDPMVDRMLTAPAKVERKTIGGANVCVGTPNVMRHPDRARLAIHGGGWTVLGGRAVLGDAAQCAAEAGCTAFSVDYRMPPDFPFPAAVDDCVAAYREIIKTYNPKKISISGASAGANLTAAVTLKIRDMGLPLPGAIGMMTLPGDLAGTGDTQATNFGIDTALHWKPGVPDAGIELYADGHDLKDPYLSPLFGDFTKGFPPSFLQSGTRDELLSDTVRMHRALLRAGVEAELHVWEAMPHGGFGFGAPEDHEVRAQFMKFIDKHLA